MYKINCSYWEDYTPTLSPWIFVPQCWNHYSKHIFMLVLKIKNIIFLSPYSYNSQLHTLTSLHLLSGSTLKETSHLHSCDCRKKSYHHDYQDFLWNHKVTTARIERLPVRCSNDGQSVICLSSNFQGFQTLTNRGDNVCWERAEDGPRQNIHLRHGESIILNMHVFYL